MGRQLYLFGLALVVLAFLPLFLDLNLIHKNSRLSETLSTSSWLVVTSFACCVAACLPMTFDLLVDLFVGFSKQTNSWFMERVVFLTAAIFPGVIYLIASSYSLSVSQFGMLMVSLFVAQRIWIALPFVSMLTASKSGVWTHHNCCLLFVVWCAVTLLAAYWDLPGRIGMAAGVATIVLAFIGFIPMLYYFVQYCWFIFKEPSISTSEIVPLVYSFLSLIYVVTLMAINSGTSYAHYAIYNVVFTNFLVILLVVAATVVPGRVARSEMFETHHLLELKHNFIRYVSHEMRTPMNVMCIGITLLENHIQSTIRYDGDAHVREILNEMKSSASTCTAVFNDLLTYDRIVSKRMSVRFDRVDPVPFVIDTLRIFSMQAEDSGISFSFPYQSDPHLLELNERRVQIDVTRMRQVLFNLASNAIKFTPIGGSIAVRLLRVNREARKTSVQRPVSKHWIRIEITDTGLGIAKENLSKVFKEIVNFNALEVHGGKGTGLGLFISKSIVDLHGGVIECLSNGIGCGCTFAVELPLDPMEDRKSSSSIMSGLDYLMRRAGAKISPKPSFSGNHHVQPDAGADDDVELGRPVSPRLSLKPEPASIDRCETSVLTGRRRSSFLSESERPNAFASPENIEPQPHDSSSILVESFSLEPVVDNANPISEFRSGKLVASDDSGSTVVKMCTSSSVNPADIGKPEVRVGTLVGDLTDRTVIPDDKNTCLRGKRVLLVDDSVVSLKMTSLLFKSFGATCLQATDGVQAVEIIRNSLMQLSREQSSLVKGDSGADLPAQTKESDDNVTPLGFSGSSDFCDGSAAYAHTPQQTSAHSGDPPSVKTGELTHHSSRDINNREELGCGSASSDSAVPCMLMSKVWSSVDIVVMDNLMPVMNGPEACLQMRQMGYTNPIFGLTGHVLEVDVKHFLSCGANHIFIKPIKSDEFLDFFWRFQNRSVDISGK